MAGKGIHCPLCEPGAADRAALDMLVWDLIAWRGLSEEAESVLVAVWAGGGAPVSSEDIFDELYRWDADGGPGITLAYDALRSALAELKVKLADTGVVVVDLGRGNGWRLALTDGAYVDLAA